jgi:hypothetical protein
MIDREAMAEAIELIGGDTGHDIRRNEIQTFGGQAASLAHALESGSVMDLDLAIVIDPIVNDILLLHGLQSLEFQFVS